MPVPHIARQPSAKQITRRGFYCSLMYKDVSFIHVNVLIQNICSTLNRGFGHHDIQLLHLYHYDVTNAVSMTRAVVATSRNYSVVDNKLYSKKGYIKAFYLLISIVTDEGVIRK